MLTLDVSYFLPGGFGGLGQAIAVWMAIHGARHLIFFFRSGADNVERAFLEELEEIAVLLRSFLEIYLRSKT